VAAFGVEKIQNGGRCHGNQGAKNVKFTPNFTTAAILQ
jgi:ribosomal protein L35AE/L33A